MSVFVSARRLFGIYSKNLPRKTKPEERLQATCVDLLRLSAFPDVRWAHAPNEAARHPIGHFIQEAMGRIVGFPDLLIWREAARGLPLYFVEFKAPNKPAKPTEEQLAFMTDAAEQGHRVAVINSFDDWVRQAKAWGLVPAE